MPVVLISVYDKTGLSRFATALVAKGWNILASGGTARAIAAAGLPVKDVSEYTHSPEILGGRVKTLHPAIHGGILSRGSDTDKAELAHIGGSEIDMVVCNLYPFEKTITKEGVSEADCVEEIDIGGIALLRAAAKNYARVAVVCDPSDYDRIATELGAEGSVSVAVRKELALKAFQLCTHYDLTIATWLDPESSASLLGFSGQRLRYGENPHQKGWFYADAPGSGPLGGRVLQGKELSYNNILDLDAAWRAVAGFSGPAAVVVKHLSPCGVASLPGSVDNGASVAGALRAAIACDPLSAFGGVIAVNRPFDADCVRALCETFIECVAVPSFSDEARELLAKRKNLRLLEMGPDGIARARLPAYEIRSTLGGFLRQEIDQEISHEIDQGLAEAAEWKVVSNRRPTDAELAALRFAWQACIAAKSNAIVLAAAIDPLRPEAGFATVGIGSGQPNRVDSTRIAITRAGPRAQGAVLASDAFFPFPDSVEVAAAAGITAIAQSGGSIRDKESIAAADSAGIAMVLTGIRHFRH